MRNKSKKAKICPKCGEETYYLHDIRMGKNRYRCKNPNCKFSATEGSAISKRQICKINWFIDFLNLCVGNKKADFNKFLYKIGQSKYLSEEKINDFKIIHKESPAAFLEDKSVVVMYHEASKELRYMLLKDYNKEYQNNSRCNITKFPPGSAYDNSKFKQNDEDVWEE